jgi:hypothetical protein
MTLTQPHTCIAIWYRRSVTQRSLRSRTATRPAIRCTTKYTKVNLMSEME